MGTKVWKYWERQGGEISQVEWEESKKIVLDKKVESHPQTGRAGPLPTEDDLAVECLVQEGGETQTRSM